MLICVTNVAWELMGQLLIGVLQVRCKQGGGVECFVNSENYISSFHLLWTDVLVFVVFKGQVNRPEFKNL